MKKKKIVAGVLFSVLILTGVGYAQWTDVLKINHTVSAGELNVEFVNTSEFLPYVSELELNSNYVNAQIDQTDTKTVVVKVENLFPGSGVLYAAKFENKGSIPAKIASVDVEFTKDNDLLKQNLVVVGGFIQMRPNVGPVNVGVFPFFSNQYYLKDLESNLNAMLSGKVLEPGDYILLDIPEEKKQDIVNILNQEGIEGYNPVEENCVIMGLPKSADNSLKKQGVEFKIKLNFKQFNQ